MISIQSDDDDVRVSDVTKSSLAVRTDVINLFLTAWYFLLASTKDDKSNSLLKHTILKRFADKSMKSNLAISNALITAVSNESVVSAEAVESILDVSGTIVRLRFNDAWVGAKHSFTAL